LVPSFVTSAMTGISISPLSSFVNASRFAAILTCE
jgi:hypothetical protein